MAVAVRMVVVVVRGDFALGLAKVETEVPMHAGMRVGVTPAPVPVEVRGLAHGPEPSVSRAASADKLPR